MEQIRVELSLLCHVLDCFTRTRATASAGTINSSGELYELLNKSSVNVVNKINGVLDEMSGTVKGESTAFDVLYDEHFGKNSPIRKPILVPGNVPPPPPEPEEGEIIIRKPVFD